MQRASRYQPQPPSSVGQRREGSENQGVLVNACRSAVVLRPQCSLLARTETLASFDGHFVDLLTIGLIFVAHWSEFVQMDSYGTELTPTIYTHETFNFLLYCSYNDLKENN